jgi:hypothetical protein
MPYPFEQQDASGADVTIEAGYFTDRLFVANFPKDKHFWALTADGEVQWLGCSHDHWLYSKRDVWQRDDGEPGEWEADDLIGWTTDQADAEEAAKLLAQAERVS